MLHLIHFLRFEFLILLDLIFFLKFHGFLIITLVLFQQTFVSVEPVNKPKRDDCVFTWKHPIMNFYNWIKVNAAAFEYGT